MTTTQTVASRTQDRLVTQLQSALHELRERLKEDESGIREALTSGLLDVRQEFVLSVFSLRKSDHLVVNEESVAASTIAVVQALNMAIGSATVDENGTFSYETSTDKTFRVHIYAEPAPIGPTGHR